jgi:hypothetical protein
MKLTTKAFNGDEGDTGDTGDEDQNFSQKVGFVLKQDIGLYRLLSLPSP